MLNLLFPKVCNSCNNTISDLENVLCVPCRHRLPIAFRKQSNDPNMMQKFYGRFPVVYSASLLYFEKKGIVQEMLHNLKYRGAKELSRFFGGWLGEELKEMSEFREVQLVIPVPLHKQKLRKRGYNQVEGFGKALAQALEVPYRDDILIKISKTGSQVFKTRLLRFEKEEVFSVQHLEDIKYLHVLLVDDIVTTGATLEKCALQLMKAEGVKISVATIATT